MFNPFPYDDNSAVNRVSWPGSEKAGFVKGNSAVASYLCTKIISLAKNKDRLVIGIDG